MRAKIRVASLAAGALCVALSATACSGAGGGSSAGDQNSINVLMVNNPSVIKRPVVEWQNGDVTVGFDSDTWTAVAAK